MSREHRTSGPTSHLVRWGILAGLWLAYFALVYLSRESHETSIGPLTAIPVLATGMLLGWRGGLASAVLATPMNLLIHLVHGAGESLAEDLADSSFGWLIGLLVGWGSGYFAEQILRQRHQALRLGASETRLAEAQSLSHIGSWERDVARGVTHFSLEMQRILGFTPGASAANGGFDGTREAFLERVVPADQARLAAALHDADNGHDLDVAFHVHRPDGAIRTLHSKGRCIKDPAGRLVRIAGTCDDVTERVQADQARQASDERFRLASLATQDVLWEWDVRTNQSYHSDQIASYGHDPAALSTSLTAFTALIHPDDLKRFGSSIEDLVAGSETRLSAEYRFRRADGTYADILDRAFVVRDAQGKAVRLVGAMQDISERKQAERAVAQRQTLLEESQAIARVGSWEIDLLKGSYTSSKEGARLYRLPSGVIQDADQILAGIHPEDRGRTQQAIQNTIDRGADDIVQRIPLPDGSLRWLRSRGELRRAADGTPARIVGFSQDITELHAAEEQVQQSGERLASLLDNLDEVYVSTDLATGKNMTSAAIERVFGHPRAAYAADPMLWSTQLHPDDAQRVMGHYGDLMAGETTLDDTRIVRADGAIRWIRAFMRPIKDPAGKVVRVDGLIRDITAEREGEEQRSQVVHLKEAAEFKTQFLNNAAHELANPLTPIRLQMASITRGIFGPLTPRQSEAIGVLARNLDRITLLVTDLLDAARLQSGRLQVAYKPVNLAPLVADVAKTFAEKARQDGITVAASGLERALCVQGDDARLAQVLFNLVHNALKFTPRGGHVEVSLREADGQAVMSVSDSGVGLTEDQIGRLFQPFVQVHDRAKHNVGGTGLGLYISHAIVEQLGGQLSVRSEGPGRGSTFEVRLPFVVAPSVSVPPRQGN